MVIRSCLAVAEIPKSGSLKCRSGERVIKEAICTIEFPPSSHSHDHEAFSKETQALKMGIVKVLLIKMHLKKDISISRSRICS